VVDFPVTYLDIPLSTSKLPKAALIPLLDRASNKLPTWKGRLMHRSGRLALIKSMLSAIPIYSSITFGWPPWMLKLLQKLMSAFLWSGTDMVQNGKHLVAWSRVQCPLLLGGLGVLDMRLLGVALRVRWLWLLKTNPSQAWTSLPAPSDSLSMALFEALVERRLGNGESFLFWTDAWFRGAALCDLAPDLV
jgi:hypothetical protein